MSRFPTGSRRLGRRGRSMRIMDKYAAVPIAAFAFALIAYPILTKLALLSNEALQIAEARPEPRIFWPAMTVVVALFCVRDVTRLSRLAWPPHIICLFAYLAFAGLSGLWAFNPAASSVRFSQQVMVVICIVVPAMLAAPSVDMMRGLFLCLAFSLLLNLWFVLNGSVDIVQNGVHLVNIGYEGYFTSKNPLGECASIALLLAVHETRHGGWRRTLAIMVVALAILLVFLSRSKTALGLAVITPFVSGLTLNIRRKTGLSPAIILLSIPCLYVLLSIVYPGFMNRISFTLYGDSTFTGRTVIWDFARQEIDRSPFVGWGYQSFWLAGSNAPSVLDAPGWVKTMPNAHNGYYDTMLELGYAGLTLLLVFLTATLHAIGRVADRDPSRGRFLLSLCLFVIFYNFLESLWMRGFEFVWVLFVVVVAEIGRCRQTTPHTGAARTLRNPRPRGPLSYAWGRRDSPQQSRGLQTPAASVPQ